MDHSALVPGDIIINKTHTMIAVGNGNVVDAWGHNYNKGVDLWNWKEEFAKDRTALKQWVFRSKTAGFGSLAAQYASSWASAKAVTLVTPWRNENSKRHMGNKEQTVKGVTFKTEDGKVILDDRRWGVNVAQKDSKFAPPFGYDALRRALKYALRMERGFSYNRGTTCCSFVISCGQSAALRLVAELPEIKSLLEKILLNGEKKRSDYPLIDGKTHFKPNYMISQLATTKGANPGFKGNESYGKDEAALFLEQCAFELTESKKSWEEIFGFEMYVDAQFTHSGRLLDRMKDKKSELANWDKVLEDGVIV